MTGTVLPAERLTGLRSGERGGVRAAITGLPRAVLAEWLTTAAGEDVLRDAFRRMPDFYLPGQLTAPATARWRVRRPPAAAVEYDLVLGPHGCVLHEPDAARTPAVTLVFDAAGFVELACAARRGVDLLLHGQLQIRGDVPLAMRMESLFGLDRESP